jgi:NAD(P)-dependent dehydrogenase (short-subunit alcohol dehydrogenase family)
MPKNFIGFKGQIMSVNGKIVIVTGGAKGIGAATALLFAQKGAGRIYLIDVDDENGKQTEQKIKGFCGCSYIHLDVSDEAGIKQFFLGTD